MSYDTYYYYNDIGFPVETIPLWNMLWNIGLLITVEQGLQDGAPLGRLIRVEDQWDITTVSCNSPQECVEKLFDYIAKNDLIDAEYKQ